MTTFTIDTDNHITAHATPEEAATATSTPFDTFSSQPEFAELAKSWPAKRLVAIWNSLPGAPADQEVPGPQGRHQPHLGAYSGTRRAGPAATGRTGHAQSRTPSQAWHPGGQGCAGQGQLGPPGHRCPERAAGQAGGSGAGSQRSGTGQQEGRGHRHAAAQERRDAVGDHADHGLAEAHGTRIYGGGDEEGRAHRRVLQARRRGPDVPPQIASVARPLRPPGTRPRRAFLL